MKTPGLFVIVSLLVVVTGAAVWVGSCKEKDVPYVIDADEIARYMAADESALNLFRSDSLIVSTPYHTPLDDAVYYDSVVAHTRQQEIIVGTQEWDYGSLGMLKEAVVYVIDSFGVTTLRVNGIDTTRIDNSRLLSRMGFFLKLGADDRPYVGWKLWGFGISTTAKPPVNVEVRPASDSSFAGDYSIYTQERLDSSLAVDTSFRYIRLSDIPRVTKGSRLAVTTTTRNPQAPARYYQLLSAADTSGFFTRPMTKVSSSEYVDTVITPSSDARLYEVVMMQSFVDSTFQFAKAWVFPYRVQ